MIPRFLFLFSLFACSYISSLDYCSFLTHTPPSPFFLLLLLLLILLAIGIQGFLLLCLSVLNAAFLPNYLHIYSLPNNSN